MLKRIIKKIYLKLYNMKNHTMIRSVNASLHASYGKNVLIDYDTIIEDNVLLFPFSFSIIYLVISLRI